MQAMRIPKQAFLTIGIAASTSLLITGIALHRSSPKPAHLSLNKSSIIQPDKETASVAPTPTEPATLGSSTTTTQSNTNQPKPPAPSNDQTPPNNKPNDIPPITAVNATFTGWTDPQPTESKFGLGCEDLSKCPNGYTPFPTVVQYRYCIWTYTDGSTQQRVYQTWFHTVGGGMAIGPDSVIDCTIAAAPTP
jgi:hypothetical protein